MTQASTLKLVDRRRRNVEVVGPRPAEWRRPRLLLDSYGLAARGLGDQPVGFCFKLGETTQFLIDAGDYSDEPRSP